MQTYSGIKRFVQENLGCTCPEEVLNKIDFQKDCADISASKVNVGGRLLIYIITMDGNTGIQEVINTALEKGVEERDRKEFNRFRMVLVTSSPDGLRSAAEKVFADSEYANEKTHLHIVSQSDVECFDSIDT